MGKKIIHDPFLASALVVLHHAEASLESENPACVAEARTWLQFVGLSSCQVLGVSEEELNT